MRQQYILKNSYTLEIYWGKGDIRIKYDKFTKNININFIIPATLNNTKYG